MPAANPNAEKPVVKIWAFPALTVVLAVALSLIGRLRQKALSARG